MSYYFLAASLPMLSFEAPPALTLDGFLGRCEEQMSPDDFRVLRALAGATETGADDTALAGNDFVRGWRVRDTQVRNACAFNRATRLQKDIAAYLRPAPGLDLRLDRTVHEAFAKADPLDLERTIDRLRWNLVDELAGHDPFTLNALLGYTLKLKIALRWAAMNAEEGRKRLDFLIDNLRSSAGAPATAPASAA